MAGDYKGYMAIMLGFYESVIVELVDKSKSERTIVQYLLAGRYEAFVPLGIEEEIYIGLPGKDVVPDERIAKLDAM